MTVKTFLSPGKDIFHRNFEREGSEGPRNRDVYVFVELNTSHSLLGNFYSKLDVDLFVV